MSLAAFLVFTAMGVAFLAMVATPFLIAYAVSDWWYNERKPPEKPVTRKCMGCGAGYDASWDPIDFTPRKARQDLTWMSGGLCPNCSGAD
jgi:hypothetical protein